MTNATMDPELEEAVDTPDAEGENEGGDGNAFLITKLSGGYEIVEVTGTDDEDVTADELIERFDNAEKKGAAFFKIGRRRIRMGNIDSIGPEDEVDYPEVQVFGLIEDRVEKLLKGVDHAIQAVSSSAQAHQFLTEQQAGLQQAQAQLFQAIQSEESLGEDDGDAPQSRPLTGGGGLKPMTKRS